MVRSPIISSPTRLLYILFAAVLPGAIHVELAQSCDQNSSPPYVCDEEQSMTYKREGGNFSSACAGSSLVDCSRCLKLTVYCHDNFIIYLSGFWIPPLRVILRCMMPDNSYNESVYMHRNYSNENLVIPAPNHYSNCLFGACYSTLPGWTYIANLTNCITLQPSETTGLESTLEEGLVSTIEAGLESTLEEGLVSTIEAGLESTLEEGLATIEAGLKSTIESDFTVLNTVMSTMPSNQTLQKESKLTTIIVLPIVALLMAMVTVTMGSYVLRLNCSRNQKRISHQIVVPQGIDVFDASFQPVSIELRIKLSESQESVYYSLDHQYEQICPQTQENSPFGNFRGNDMVNNTPADDGYSVVKELDNNTIEEYCPERVHHKCGGEKVTTRNYYQEIPLPSQMDYDDSSGFVSAGFDYVDTRECGQFKLQPSDLQHSNFECHHLDQSRKVFDETNNDKMWPELMEPIVNSNLKDETDVSAINENCNDLEKDIFYEASDSEVEIENPLYEIDYIEELCLTPEGSPDVGMQHYSSESDLSSHYVVASGDIAH